MTNNEIASTLRVAAMYYRTAKEFERDLDSQARLCDHVRELVAWHLGVVDNCLNAIMAE